MSKEYFNNLSKMESSGVVLPLAVLLTALAVTLSLYRRSMLGTDSFADSAQNNQSGKPTLFWFVDSETNSRHWWDFGARNSNMPNRGYLQVSLEALKRTQSADFNIVPLIGRQAVLDLLPNADRKAMNMPPALWRTWVIANLCSSYGGLVMDANSTLCLGPSFAPLLQNVPAAMFGTDPAEARVSTTTGVAPGPAPYVGWAQAPHHPGWDYAAKEINDLTRGGPQSWTAAVARRYNRILWVGQKERGIIILRAADGGRYPDGRLRVLEDLFGRLADDYTNDEIAILPQAVFVSWDGDDLVRRYEFNWFCALNADDVRNTNTIWTKLATS